MSQYFMSCQQTGLKYKLLQASRQSMQEGLPTSRGLLLSQSYPKPGLWGRKMKKNRKYLPLDERKTADIVINAVYWGIMLLLGLAIVWLVLFGFNL